MQKIGGYGSFGLNRSAQTSKSPSLPHYLPRLSCLAIYGGPDRYTDIAGSGYDAPHTAWSKAWRMPTVGEMRELISVCKVSFKPDGELWLDREQDGVITSALIIKLPKTPDGYGIWTASIDPMDNNKAYALIVDFEKQSISIETKDRECQFAILPVTDSQFFQNVLW